MDDQIRAATNKRIMKYSNIQVPENWNIRIIKSIRIYGVIEFRIIPNRTLNMKYFSTHYGEILFILAFIIIYFSNDKFGTLLMGKFIAFETKTTISLLILLF